MAHFSGSSPWNSDFSPTLTLLASQPHPDIVGALVHVCVSCSSVDTSAALPPSDRLKATRPW